MPEKPELVTKVRFKLIGCPENVLEISGTAEHREHRVARLHSFYAPILEVWEVEEPDAKQKRAEERARLEAQLAALQEKEGV